MPTVAQFGQNNVPDPNTQTGWTVQSGGQVPDGVVNGVVTTALGVPGACYAQPSTGGVQSVFTGNGSPGAPSPVPGNATDILVNPGYADVNAAYLTPGVALPASVVPVSASNVAFQSPTSLAATVVIAGGTLTSVKTAAPGGTLTQVGTADGTYTVPAGGQIELTYTAAPTWTWTTAITSGAA